MEHGAFSVQEATQICIARADRIAPLVRVCTGQSMRDTVARHGAMGLSFAVDTPRSETIADAFHFRRGNAQLGRATGAYVPTPDVAAAQKNQ